MPKHSITGIHLRNGDLQELRSILTEERVRRLDLITTAPALSMDGGRLRVDTDEVVLTEDGVSAAGGWYEPTAIFNETLGARLKIPGGYLHALREQNRIGLYDQTVNNYLHGEPDYHVGPFQGKAMIRLFRGDETGGGVARAFLSDRFKTVDHLDMLVAALSGMQEAGLGPENITKCDLSDRRMYVQVAAPSVQALAPSLLKGYRNPVTGEGGKPIVFAGFVLTNSETGDGKAKIIPRVTVQICTNGMTFSQDAIGAIHLGGKRDEGVVQYKADTLEAELQLVTKRARDAVATFLDVDYVKGKIEEMEEKSGTEVTEPEKTVKQVIREATLPVGLEDDVFKAFIKGGQTTAGGVMQAVTAVAQTVDNPDVAYEMEDKAAKVLEIAARIG